jgi:hypothetical protein
MIIGRMHRGRKLSVLINVTSHGREVIDIDGCNPSCFPSNVAHSAICHVFKEEKVEIPVLNNELDGLNDKLASLDIFLS